MYLSLKELNYNLLLFNNHIITRYKIIFYTKTFFEMKTTTFSLGKRTLFWPIYIFITLRMWLFFFNRNKLQYLFSMITDLNFSQIY